MSELPSNTERLEFLRKNGVFIFNGEVGVRGDGMILKENRFIQGIDKAIKVSKKSKKFQRRGKKIIQTIRDNVRLGRGQVV